jgi:hypothetical protein
VFICEVLPAAWPSLVAYLRRNKANWFRFRLDAGKLATRERLTVVSTVRPLDELVVLHSVRCVPWQMAADHIHDILAAVERFERGKESFSGGGEWLSLSIKRKVVTSNAS